MTELTSKEQKFHVIDLAEAQNVICSKYGEHYITLPDALWEAAALWGVTPETCSINDCGVFTSRDDVIQLQSGGCRTAITLVKAPNGYWAMSIGCHTSTSGYGYAPSIWHRQAFPTRDDARLAGLCELIDCLQSTAKCLSRLNDESNRHQICKMIALLEAAKTPQLSLF